MKPVAQGRVAQGPPPLRRERHPADQAKAPPFSNTRKPTAGQYCKSIFRIYQASARGESRVDLAGRLVGIPTPEERERTAMALAARGDR